MKVGESVSEEIQHEVWGADVTSIRARNWILTRARVEKEGTDVVWDSVREPVSDLAQSLGNTKQKSAKMLIVRKP